MQLHVTLTGRSGLVMHNGRLADPIDDMAKAISEITDKRDKTPTDQEQIADLEWRGSLYFDRELGTYIPSGNVIRSFRDAATAWKLGEKVYDAVHLLTDKVPLAHDGPKNIDALAKKPEHRWRTTVRIGRNRTARTRPIFRQWTTSFDVELEESELKVEDFARIIERAGRLEGLGDARRLGYGRFVAEVTAR